MRLNRTSMWKVMTIWISRELPLCNFESLDILCAWIGLPCHTLWPFEFLESFRCSISSFSIYYAPESDFRFKSYDNFEFLECFHCSISSVSIYYAPEPDFRVISYDHLNYSRAFVVQFRASRYIMRLNQTSVWQVTTIWLSREPPLFNFERLGILCAWIRLPCDMLWPFEFLESFRCSISSFSIYYAPESDFRLKSYDHLNFSTASAIQFQASRYIMHLNQTSVWKVMTIWISRELPLCNFERLYILCAWIGLPCDKLWPLEFLESFRYSISCFSIYYVPESDFRLKSYDHLIFSRASVVQFRASRYIMRLNRSSVWKVMTIWISWELPLFNYEVLDILSAEIGLPCDKLWPFEFLESFRYSISSFSIYYAPESDFRLKIYGHLNFSRASIVQFRASLYIMRLNRTSVW